MIDSTTAAFLNQYFDKIFVITLERAKDRQKKVLNTLSALNFDFFIGVDKKSLDYNMLQEQGIYNDNKARKLDRHGKGMVLGAIACSLSHKTVYEHIIHSNYQRVLVFEDDVAPLIKNLPQLPETLRELPADWELVYLGYTKHEDITPSLKRKQAFYKLLSSMGLMKWNPAMVNNLLPLTYSKHLKIAGYHDCTHAYAITASSANKLIEVQTPVVFNSDNLLSYTVLNGQLNAFITDPKFFDQDHFANPADQSFIHD